MSPSDARADRAEALRALNTAKRLHSEGSYFRSARYAFAATEADGKLQAEAYSWITLGLVDAGLYQTASYFFIRTLQSVLQKLKSNAHSDLEVRSLFQGKKL